jgi:6-phosphogluconolactonase
MVAAASTSQGKNSDPNSGTGAVYVMSNQDTGNSVTVFDRAADGGLTRLGTFPTGGVGAGNSINAQNDPLTSQGALAVSEDHRFLFAADAGSNEVSVLAVEGQKLIPVDRVSSGGVRPVSVTIHKNLLYVLNNTDGTITGFTVSIDGTLSALARSTQTLIGGTNADPAQVRFTPDGSQLVVTEKKSNVIDVLPVDGSGRAGPPVKNDSSGRVPFGFTFAGKDILIVSELSNATSSYRIAPDGTLTVISGSVSTAEQGACWVVTNSITDPRYAYVSNAVSGSITGYRIDGTGALSLLNRDGHTAVTSDSHAALDSAVSSGGQFLYVLTAGFSEPSNIAVLSNKMTISAFRIETDGSLDVLPGFGNDDDTDPPVGLAPGSEGIVAI